MQLAIAELLVADSPRVKGENAAHVRMLAESPDDLPPILVHRLTMHVIDGRHRLKAAQLRGDSTITAVFFDGEPREAFVLAVRLNMTHGLPLSLADRKAAALRIVSLYPEWSNRAIAAASGISDKTVGVIRRNATAEIPQSTDRIARNGVLHRAGSREGRLRAAALFVANPVASTRAVATAAGISATTAKNVRDRLRRGEDPVPPRQRAAEQVERQRAESAERQRVESAERQRVESAERQRTERFERRAEPAEQRADTTMRNVNAAVAQRRWTPDLTPIVQRLRSDPSLRFTESGRVLLRWLEASAAAIAERDKLAANLPDHCVPAVAALAQQYSEELRQFAAVLNRRIADAS